MPTLLLSAADIRRLLDREALLRALRAAFAQYSTRKVIPALRAGSPLPGPAPAVPSAPLPPGLWSGKR